MGSQPAEGTLHHLQERGNTYSPGMRRGSWKYQTDVCGGGLMPSLASTLEEGATTLPESVGSPFLLLSIPCTFA